MKKQTTKLIRCMTGILMAMAMMLTVMSVCKMTSRADSFGYEGAAAMDFTLTHNEDGSYTISNVSGYDISSEDRVFVKVCTEYSTMMRSDAYNWEKSAIESSLTRTGMSSSTKDSTLSDVSEYVEITSDLTFSLSDDSVAGFVVIVYGAPYMTQDPLTQEDAEFRDLAAVGIAENPAVGSSSTCDLVLPGKMLFHENTSDEACIVNSSDIETLCGVTDEEMAQGVGIDFYCSETTVVQDAEKEAIEAALGDNELGLYLYMGITKKVGNTSNAVTETNGKVKISITVPEILWKSGRAFKVIRVHDGEATVLDGIYDETTHVFTFETDKFSTYAIVYQDAASNQDQASNQNVDTNQNGEASQNAAANEETVTPQTGDASNPGLWLVLTAVAAAAGIGGCAVIIGRVKKAKK